MPRLSVCVTTCDSAATLAACLSSVAWADDLVVLDSGSRDETAAIAERFGARWFTQPFAGYAKQKQAALDLARHDWVLLLDADERLSPALAAEVQSLLTQPRDSLAAGYALPRREQTFWRLAHAGISRNRYVRLVDRDRARLSDAVVHESVLVDGPVEELRGDLLHHSETSIAVKVAKLNTYSTLAADDFADRATPRRVGWLDLLARPPWAFVRNYVLQRNALNGRAGFLCSAIGAMGVFLKYAKAIERQQRDRMPRAPEAIDEGPSSPVRLAEAS